MKFRHISKNNTRCYVLHVVTVKLFLLATFIHTYIYPRTHKHTHTHTHTHTYTNSHTDLNFKNFWKGREIKYTSNWDNAGPRNLIHRNSCFLMETLDLRKLLSKLKEMPLACNFVKKWTLSQDFFEVST